MTKRTWHFVWRPNKETYFNGVVSHCINSDHSITLHKEDGSIAHVPPGYVWCASFTDKDVPV